MDTSLGHPRVLVVCYTPPRLEKKNKKEPAMVKIAFKFMPLTSATDFSWRQAVVNAVYSRVGGFDNA